MSADHPQKAQLVAFGQGLLAESDSMLVEQHLEGCRECCETLLDLKDDTFVGLVKRARDVEVALPEAACGDAAGLTEAMQVTPSGAADEAVEERHSQTVLVPQAATMLLSAAELGGIDQLPPELVEHPRYRIVELIGRGGMGNVYRAEHRLMNRPVAIKLINAQLVRHSQAIERFRREVQAAAKLSHPNIVAAFDAEQAGDAHFLVMEFVEGTDLASYVAEHGPMSVEMACRCIRQAADGLQHAHEKGMVHRDIKPHNLMLTANGQVRILDFGLAGIVTGNELDESPALKKWDAGDHWDEGVEEPSHASQAHSSQPSHSSPTAGTASDSRHQTAKALTLAGSVMGTPDYMAPEQAVDAHAADIRADIYSLGCTLFFLLTGKPPFEAANVVGKFAAHAKQEPPVLQSLRADVSPELQRAVSRMLAKQPDDRFQAPAEVVAALEPLARPRLNQQQRQRQRLGLLIATVSCALALLLGGVVVAISSKGRLEIRSEVDDVKVIVKQGGEQVEVFDLKTGSQMKWLPGGDYELELVGNSNDVKLDRDFVQLSRFGQAIVTATWSSAGQRVVRAFKADEKPITQDGIVSDDGGWKLSSTAARTVRLFEVPQPNFDVGPFFFRAKLKTENVTGRAYLEMWNRAPGKGEFFSKGFHNAVTGTTGWAEYEIPFFLKKGEQVDLVKLNVTIEGSGTVWIKDIELRGRSLEPQSKPTEDAEANAVVSQNAAPNLITDPSFESTPTTQLPTGWRAWLNDGQEFRCEVVAGGHTGERCLRISGKGTRGVVFANDLQADRSKRYALKGWAKFEGDKDARAIIKLNYFRGGEFLGVHDLVGATADQPGWHLFEKTDALDAYPTADHFYAMCHVEGSGTGWFDDLELVAYDRDKLPVDFDLKHGRHNRLHGPNSLQRWVGTWNADYTFRETDNSPQETSLAMTTVSERTLGNFFVMSHSQAKAPATEERLQLLSFDQELGAFRQWNFSSNGKALLWRGPWNIEKQTLELRMLPDASNLHAEEHFIDTDRIEAKLWFQYVMGQRDAGRWTATRTAPDGKIDLPIAKAPAPEPAELSQLNKFAGEWTIRATYKPSVWNPQQREETATEKSEWILGGRFLLTRCFNEKDELTSIWIATYKPSEKSNQFWSFRADGSSGESRLTWDEAMSGFQFRSVDAPSGWSITGFNRWVNEDSFDNDAIIKDGQDRVLLDMTQQRRRKK